MKIKVMTASSAYAMERDVNSYIEEISKEDSVVLDIKFTDIEDTYDRFCTMIIYCDKAEMRDVKINNILGA